jgi:AraC family transcriptional regulator
MPPSAAGAYDIPPGTRFRGHEHNGLHLCAVLRGGFREWHGRDTTVVSPGLLRISPSSAHDIHFGDAGARCLVVEVSDHDASALRRLPAQSEFVADPWLTSLTQRLDLALRPGQSLSSAHDLMLELLAQIARREMGRPSGPPPRWLVSARAHLADQWRTPPSAETLAREAGVHRVHLVRSFRDHFGCTLRGYVRRRRVARAVGMLSGTRVPLSQVAAECGFADQAHLTRSVQQALGVTPLTLRRRAGHPGITSVQDVPRRVLLA